MTTETDIQATYEKWLGSRADDPTLPHDLIRDAFLAGVEAERQTRGQPAVGEEIHVHIEGLDVLTLPLASSGIGAPRFVVHVPAQPDVSLTPDVQTDRQGRMPSDAEILACLRPLYSNDVAAAMGAEDDLRTARLLLSRYAAPVAAQAQPQQSENQEALADTQRAIIEAAERRGYERAIAECAQDREDAERWRFIIRKVCAIGTAGSGYEFQVINLPRPLGNPMQGSVAQHFSEAIDAARAAKGAGHA